MDGSLLFVRYHKREISSDRDRHTSTSAVDTALPVTHKHVNTLCVYCYYYTHFIMETVINLQDNEDNHHEYSCLMNIRLANVHVQLHVVHQLNKFSKQRLNNNYS